MRKRNDTKKSENTEVIRTPSWLEVKGHDVFLQGGGQNSSGVQQLQHNRTRTERNDSDRRPRRVRVPKVSNENRPPKGSTNRERDPKRRVDEGTGNRSVQQGLEFEFTLDEIANSIDNRLLLAMYEGRHNRSQRVTIRKTSAKISQFAEDALIQRKVPRKRKVSSKKYSQHTPSEIYQDSVSKFLGGEIEPDAETVLGFYFQLYKRFFHEEDPEWSSKSPKQCITLVNKMAAELNDGNFKPLVIFIRKLMPLWHRRLKQGESFPNSRPTTQALFGGKRHFWANRKLYFKQWQLTK